MIFNYFKDLVRYIANYYDLTLVSEENNGFYNNKTKIIYTNINVKFRFIQITIDFDSSFLYNDYIEILYQDSRIYYSVVYDEYYEKYIIDLKEIDEIITKYSGGLIKNANNI